MSFVSVFVTTGCELFTRLSVIYLYYRLFSVKSWLGLSLKVLAATSVVWYIGVVFAITFECKPVAASVDASIKGECFDAQFGFIVTEGINLVLDLALAILPIRTIWSLRLPLKNRVSIVVIFLTGGL